MTMLGAVEAGNMEAAKAVAFPQPSANKEGLQPWRNLTIHSMHGVGHDISQSDRKWSGLSLEDSRNTLDLFDHRPQH
jgi:hypothetical protein